MHQAGDTRTSARHSRPWLGRRAPAALLITCALAAAGCGGGQEAKDEPAFSTPTATQTVAEPTRTTALTALPRTVARVHDELRGIPQQGLVLGSPSAPVSIIEYGAFECPTCAAVHGNVLPQVIERYVRTGKASLEFRGHAGDSASPARDLALGAHAAAAQGRGWDFVQLAYLRSLEHGGALPEPSARLAAALGLDVQGWSNGLETPARSAQIRAAANVAAVARFSTYPVFLVRARDNPGHPFIVLTDPSSVRAFAGAIEKAQKRGV